MRRRSRSSDGGDPADQSGPAAGQAGHPERVDHPEQQADAASTQPANPVSSPPGTPTGGQPGKPASGQPGEPAASQPGRPTTRPGNLGGEPGMPGETGEQGQPGEQGGRSAAGGRSSASRRPTGYRFTVPENAREVRPAPQKSAQKSAQKPTPRPGEPEVHSITAAAQAHSDDMDARIRRYLISMGIRTACVILVFVIHNPVRWVFAVFAVILPYVAVVMANAVGSRRRGGVPAVTPAQVRRIELPESEPLHITLADWEQNLVQNPPAEPHEPDESPQTSAEQPNQESHERTP